MATAGLEAVGEAEVAAFRRDGARIATASEDSTVRVFDVASAEQRHVLVDDLGPAGVQEDSAMLHGVEDAGTDEAAGGLGRSEVYGQRVGALGDRFGRVT